MYKNKTKLKKIIIFLFLLLSLTIGYAYLTKRLSIAGNTTVTKTSWMIYFDNVQKTGGNIENDIMPTIDDEKTSTSYLLTLTKPGDYYEYTIDVVNDGTVDAMIDDVTLEGLTEEQKELINFDVKYINGQELNHCDLLSAGSKETLKITITYKEDANKDNLSQEVELDLIHKINYVQSDSCATAIKHNVIIDPNGGVYKNSTEIFTSSPMEVGDKLEIEEPVREGYIFGGWSVSEEDRFKDNIITMGNNTITLKAKWFSEGGIVARINSNYYETIQSAIDDSKENDIIYLLKDTNESPINDKIVTLNLQGYTITGTFTNKSTITLISTLENTEEAKENGVGTIESFDSTAFINNGTLTLGIHDEEIKTDNIAIIASASQIGLQQNGIFNFFDGYLEGKIGLSGTYHETPFFREDDQGTEKHYAPFVDHNNEKNCQKVYLSAIDRAVAKEIAENGKEIFYYNLQDAINTSVITGYDIYAIRNFEAAYTLTVKENESTLFDLCGYQVNTGYTITNNGTLTITDTAQIKGSLNNSLAITNNGTLKLKNVAVKQTTAANVIDQKGTLEIENSTITATSGYALYNTVGGTLKLDDTTVLSSNTYAIYNNSSDLFTLDGGKIKGIYNNGNMKVQNTLELNQPNTSTQYAIYNKRYMTVENAKAVSSIQNIGTNNDRDVKLYIDNLTSTSYIYTTYGQLEISNSVTTSVSSNYYSTTKINSTQMAGVGCTNSATTTLTDVEINNSSTTSTSAGITNNNTSGATINFVSGVLTSNSSGILMRAGTINIGSNDGIVNKDQVKILSKTNGIQIEKGVTINYYDGIIGGVTAATNYGYTSIPNKYTIIEDVLVEEGITYQINYLEPQKPFLEVNGSTFDNFAEAYSAITETDGTIKVIENATAIESLTIGSGKNITLDLNGHEINLSGKFTNNGTFTVTDSVGEGALIGTSNSTLLNNSSNLIVNNVELSSTADAIYIITNSGAGASTSITNSKIFAKQGIYSYGNSRNYAKASIKNSEINIENNLATAVFYGVYNQYSNLTIEESVVKVSGNNNNYSTSSTYQKAKYGIYQVTYGTTNIINSEIEVHSAAKKKTDTYSTFASGIYAESTVNITGTTIISDGYGLYTKSNATLDDTDMTVLYYGIYSNSNSNTITYKSGTISGGEYGVYTYSTFNIGDNSNAVDFETPIIIGKKYGISNNTSSKLNFYDGIIKGVTGATLNPITSYPNKYTSAEGEEIIDGVTYITISLDVMKNFIVVGDEGFNSLDDAIAAIETEGTMTLISNAQIGTAATIPAEKNITFDLNGFRADINTTINNNGTLTIKDSVGNGKLIQSGNYNLITNNKNFILESGTLEGSTGKYAIYSRADNVSTIINGGTITGYHGVYNQGAISTTSNTDLYATFVMNGGVIDIKTIDWQNTVYSVYNTYTNATFTDATIIMGKGETNISNYMSGVGLYLGKGTTTINSLEFQISKAGLSATLINSSGDIIIHNIKSETQASIQMNSGTATIYNAEINGAIYQNNGTLNIYDGIYNVSTSYALSVSYGTANVYGGTFTNSSGYGVYGGRYSTITIGKNDGTIQEYPVFQGSTYGVYIESGSKTYYYDGVVKGITDSFSGTPTAIATDSVQLITKEKIEENEFTVTRLSIPYNIVKNGDVEYENLQTAIDEATSGDTLTFIDSASIMYSVVIPSDLKLTIDLNGHILKTTSSITNNGELVILDNSADKTSYIEELQAANILINNNILTINNINMKSNYDKYIISNESTGTLKIYDSILDNFYGSISNKGETLIENCEFPNDIEYSTDDYSVANYSGNLEMKNTVSSLGIYNASGANMNLSKNNINTSTHAISNYGNLTTDGDEITSTIYINRYGINSSSAGTIVLNNTMIDGGVVAANANGNFTINNCELYFPATYYYREDEYIITNSTNMTINDTTLYKTGTSGIKNTATLNFNNSELVAPSSYGIKNTGIFNFNNSKVSGKKDDGVNTSIVYAIYNDGSGTFNFNSGEINMGAGYGIYNTSSATTYLKKGTITLNNTSDVAYGVYINNGTVVMGEKDETENTGTINADVSITDPLVSAISTNTGIGVKKENGYFMYYDGKIIGSTNAKPDTTTEVEYNYEATAHIDEETGYEYVILEYMK